MNRAHCDNCDRVIDRKIGVGKTNPKGFILKNMNHVDVEVIVVYPLTGHRVELCDACRDEIIDGAKNYPVPA